MFAYPLAGAARERGTREHADLGPARRAPQFPRGPPCPAQVLRVNGAAVNNLRDLVAAVAASTGRYLSFDLEYNQVGAAVCFGCLRFRAAPPGCQLREAAPGATGLSRSGAQPGGWSWRLVLDVSKEKESKESKS